ncbi:unnamed protein product [Acanthoscelides obtectus]|uniref:Uncharacterized protein n=1 Tax=Acanthoscelides obtectus TaxID=200917 RepID=A0A9P0PCG9_ACAOB|nr:unnamed protein product [Acanthoscelides obtectus]CAK1665144.1 hypothetical protein AOBTE_LOCUS24680 [Acanthoscelides obtectus]
MLRTTPFCHYSQQGVARLSASKEKELSLSLSEDRRAIILSLSSSVHSIQCIYKSVISTGPFQSSSLRRRRRP